MEFFLPMEKCIRTKVVITKENGIIIYQQNRKKLFYTWKKKELDKQLIIKISQKIKQINKSKWGFAIKERFYRAIY